MKYVLTVAMAVIIAGVVFWGYRYSKPKTLGDEELVQKIAKVMVLPEEAATIATVNDKTKLDSQTFFKNSENGDKVIIFPKAAKAILYRPVIGKIVEVATVTSISEFQQVLKPEPTMATSKTRVAVYNGSGRPGMAAMMADEILAKVDSFEVVTKTDAVKQYPKTVVVCFDEAKRGIAETLAKELNGEVQTLPDREKKPEAEILLIVGRNFGE